MTPAEEALIKWQLDAVTVAGGQLELDNERLRSENAALHRRLAQIEGTIKRSADWFAQEQAKIARSNQYGRRRT